MEFLSLFNETSDDEADDGHDIDEDVHGRARGVLKGVTDGIAYDAGGVSFRSLTAVVAVFDMLFSVVPRTTGI